MTHSFKTSPHKKFALTFMNNYILRCNFLFKETKDKYMRLLRAKKRKITVATS